ncbi:MAG: Bug family tripartite tricarboxylate transporter substrate binding protein, partial [Burkholderiales bacterium]
DLGIPQQYPDKPIRLVISLAPGGGTDILARRIAAKLSENLGQQVVPDNRPAVDGVIATEIVARAHPDGYTLLFVSSSHANNVAIGRKLPYDAIKDFSPITQTASQQLVMVVTPSLPVKSIRELIDLAKAKPGVLNYGASSNAVQLPMELFNSMAGIKTNYIPYKGSAPTLLDLMAGRIELTFSPAIAAVPFIKSGKLRALATGDLKRSAAFPDLPTVAESGIPKFQATAWTGVLGPAKLPRPMVDKLNKEIVAIVQGQELKDWLQQNGSDPVGSTPEAFTAFIKAEITKWSAIAKAINLKPET